MLYLFGQLALSDSLYYHEDFDREDHPAPVATSAITKPEVSARPVAAGPRLHCEHHLLPADRAATSQPR